MAGASDKARFYLEQAVPELREWERREIFTKDELSSIASKRSDFEHIINARGSAPADYTRYIEYEMNLDALHRKRVKRKGVKSTSHAGQRRIFFLLDRATRKFPGDVALWMQYADYARKQRANKKLARVLTDLLRMHPTKPELWIYAARYAIDVQADIAAARSYMQRGLRFCKTSHNLYLEYARLEMTHVAKFAARRRILGLDVDSATTQQQQHQVESSPPAQDDVNADVISLSAALAGDIESDSHGQDTSDESTLDKLASTPAMTGAIPLAIFQVAMQQPSANDALAVKFFNMLAEFDQVPCTTKILQAVIARLLTSPPPAIDALACRCRMPLIGVPPTDRGYPAALRTMLAEIKSATSEAGPRKSELAAKLLTWLSPLAHQEDLGPEVKRVLTATEAQLIKTADSE